MTTIQPPQKIMLKTSPSGRKFIRTAEGAKSTKYQCSAGKWTIGVGHVLDGPDYVLIDGVKVDVANGLTDTQIDQLFSQDLQVFEQWVNRLVHVNLSQNQFDTLVSFCFNIGPGAFAKSTLLRHLNAGQYDMVPHELIRWTKAGGQDVPGLVKRRRAEIKLWLGQEGAA